MVEKEKCYWGSEKSVKWFLKQEKAVDTKKIEKKREKKKRRKEKEKERNKVVIQGNKSVLKNPGHL